MLCNPIAPITYPTGESINGRVDQRASRSLLPRPHQTSLPTLMPSQQHHLDASKERQIQLAVQALKQDANLSQRRAAAIYRVPQSTLRNRLSKRPSRADSAPNSRNLDDNEERVIVDHTLQLAARGSPPRLAAVADMANSLRAERSLGHVGLN